MIEEWYILDVNPEPWAIGPVGYRRLNGKMSAYVGRNQQLDAYKEAVREAIADQAPRKVDGPVDITFFFWRNRAEYTTPQARTHRKHEADATNMQKATEDALQGVLYDNDKDNIHVESWIVEQGPDVEPRVVVRCTSAGVFDSNIIPDHVWDKIDRTDTRTGRALPGSNEWHGPDSF